MKTDKLCTGCGETKPIEMYCIERAAKDGRQRRCKECARRYRQTPAGKASSAKSNRKFYKTEAGKIVKARKNKKYSQTEKGKAAQKRSSERKRKRYPERIKAHRAVNNGVRDGRVERPLYCCVDSSECEGQIEGHHWDYSRPLDVTWLCQKHHRWVHQNEATK